MSSSFSSSSLGNLRIALQVNEVVSPPTPNFVYLSQDSHSKICSIYDKETHLQPPFQKIYEREDEGVEDLACSNVRETT